MPKVLYSVGVREYNLEGMSHGEQIDLLAYEHEQITRLRQRLTDMRLKHQEGTKKYAQLEEVLRHRKDDVRGLAQQIGGLDAQADDLLAGYYDD